MNAAHRHFCRRRILVLAPRDPYPVTGGDRLRIHRMARELARHHELTLLTLCRSPRERDAPAPSDGVFSRVHRVLLPRWRSCVSALAALPTREPLQVAYYRSREFRAAVERLAPAHDVVLTHLIRTAEYARDVSCLRVLEMTDAISMSMQRAARRGAGCFDPRRLLYAIEGARMPSYERRVAQDFDTVLLTSSVDNDFLFDVPGDDQRRVMIVPNGVDLPHAPVPGQRSRHSDEIVFVGNLHTLQNFDAVWFFARKVLPAIRASRRDAIFRVIGPVRWLAARRLAAIPGVRVEGMVPELSEALATARVGVCPTQAGAGVQNKVLDYLANGLAVVCSPVGLEGLRARVGEHVLLADAPDEWADSVVGLLTDEAVAQRLADAGRALVTRDYRWDQCMLPLLRRLEQLSGDMPDAASLPLARTGS
jgi:glycosyltransferase involved in cell wall biosynthesis